MEAYIRLLKKVLLEGKPRKDRTGTGTFSLFGEQIHIDLQKGFPLLTTKEVHFPSIAHELLWFLRGEDHIGYLRENGITIWDEWADPKTGFVGPLYGTQWTRWKSSKDEKPVNQIEQLIRNIIHDPSSRRLLVSAWNVGLLNEMKLPPCHVLFQIFVEEGKISCQCYQRSADLFLGVPFNIASYALLTHLIAHICNLTPDRLILVFGDVHLYQNHLDQAEIQLKRSPRSLPRLELKTGVRNIFDFSYEDIKLLNYHPYSRLRADVSV
ncbi:MAG: thymidylate synthase [Cytophagales bacterium]|nr:thymidylate synthase [Cytophagales bacterium]